MQEWKNAHVLTGIKVNKNEKIAIAKATCALVDEGGTIMLDSETTIGKKEK